MTTMRRAGLAAASALGAFHLWLFVGQAQDGQLADPALVLRWLAAAGLLAALAALRRGGVSPLASRQALVVWLLAALLHAPVMVDRSQVDGRQVQDFANALAQSVASCVLAGGLVLLLTLRRRPVHPGVGLRLGDWTARTCQAAVTGRHAPPFAPRPPPVPRCR